MATESIRVGMAPPHPGEFVRVEGRYVLRLRYLV